MSRLPEKIIFSLMGLVLLGWMGYHIVSYYYRPMELETIFDYTVSDSFSASGIAIRDERVIEERASGIENYLYADAERVTVNEPVAEFYSSRGSDRNVKRMREIEDEIEMLRLTQDKNANSFASADSLNRDIRDQLGKLSSMAGADAYGQAADIRKALRELLNRRQIATGKAENYNSRIAELEMEYSGLARSTSGADMVTVRTPVSGYFVKTVDGYEKYLTPRLMDEYKLQDYKKLLTEAARVAPAGQVGKMVVNHNWYFVVSAPKEHIENFRQGQRVELEFVDIGTRTPAVIDQILRENSSNEAVVVLHCTYFDEALAGVRRENVRVHSTLHTGLRLNTAAIRYVDGVMGTYVVEENVLRFKEVNVTYEGNGFVLAEMNILATPEYKKSQVRLYNQVVTRGTDLYDGKTMG